MATKEQVNLAFSLLEYGILYTVMASYSRFIWCGKVPWAECDGLLMAFIENIAHSGTNATDFFVLIVYELY